MRLICFVLSCMQKGLSSYKTLTERPDKVVFWPESQHGQVKVDHLQVEGCGVDKVAVDGAVHREQLAQREIDGQRDAAGAQLGDDVILGGGGERRGETKQQPVTNHI